MKIGWIGTGVMGEPMAGHLQNAGHELSVYNRTKEKAASLVANGAAWCDTPAQIVAQSEIIFTMLGHPEDVESTYFGERGILGSKGSVRIVVDMTSSRPTLARNIYEEAKRCNIESLDAPVSGGDVGAREAILAIMAGGKKDTFEQVLPLFKVMGKTISFMGGPGAGQHTKVCNQILVAGTMIGVCESLLYASKLGLDRHSVIDIVEKGAAGSWSISNLGRRIAKGDTNPGFFVEHFIKDMGIALQEASAAGIALPGLALVQQLYIALKAQGHGRSGTQALILALEKLSSSD